MISGDVWFETGAAKTFVTIAEQMLRRRRRGHGAALARADRASLLVDAYSRPGRGSTSSTQREGMGVPRRRSAPAGGDRARHPEVTGPSVLRAGRADAARTSWPIRSARCTSGSRPRRPGTSHGRAVPRARGRAPARAGQARAAHPGARPLRVGGHVHGRLGSAAAAGAEAARLARDTRQPQYGLTGELIAALVCRTCAARAPTWRRCSPTPEQTLRAMNGGPLLAPAHLARGAAALGDGATTTPSATCGRSSTKPTRRSIASCAGRRCSTWSRPAARRARRAGRRCDGRARGDRSTQRTADPARRADLRAAAAGRRPRRETLCFAAALGQDSTAHTRSCARGRCSRSAGGCAGSGAAPRRASRCATRSSCSTRSARRAGASARDRSCARRARRIGRRTPDARDRLTAQELQIAQLAAEGLSNREIGERLFLSHRTIGSHLYRIFPKLGITARAQLRDALPRPLRADRTSHLTQDEVRPAGSRSRLSRRPHTRRVQ